MTDLDAMALDLARKVAPCRNLYGADGQHHYLNAADVCGNCDGTSIEPGAVDTIRAALEAVEQVWQRRLEAAQTELDLVIEAAREQGRRGADRDRVLRQGDGGEP